MGVAPLVSVIVRTVWRATLGRSLAAVAAQSYPNIETLIVDAAGHGRPPAVSGRNVRIVADGKPHSRADAANLGLGGASGELLIFLDDDDEFDAAHVGRLAAALDASPCRAAYSDARALDARGDVVRVFDRPWSHVRLHHGNLFPLHAVMFARSLVDAGCRFDPSLVLLEDWDFWLQVAERTAFAHVPGQSAIYHIEAGSSGAGALGNYDAGQARAATDIVAKRWEHRRIQLLEGLWADREEAFRLTGAGRCAEAEPGLRSALAFDDADADAMSMLARCALAGSRPAEAISLLERAVAVQPQRPDFRINLALALERAGRIAEARVLLAGIPANSPAHTHAQRVLSRLSAAPR